MEIAELMVKGKRKGCGTPVRGFYVWDAIKDKHIIMVNSPDCGYEVEKDSVARSCGHYDAENNLGFVGDVTEDGYQISYRNGEFYLKDITGSSFPIGKPIHRLKKKLLR